MVNGIAMGVDNTVYSFVLDPQVVGTRGNLLLGLNHITTKLKIPCTMPCKRSKPTRFVPMIDDRTCFSTSTIS
jgi:hypothetical protein